MYAFSSLNDLGHVITSNGGFEEVTKSGLYLILGTVSAAQGAIFRYEEEHGRFVVLAHKGVDGAPHLGLSLYAGDAEALVGAPGVVESRRASQGLTGFISRNDDTLGALQAALLVPLRVGGNLVGLITVGSRFSGGDYTDDDLQILAMMSQQLSVGLSNHQLFQSLQKKVEENRALYENLQDIYNDTVRAFAAAIDAKDRYTQGHSDRVARYAVAIAEELGLPQEEVEALRLGGLLHDIGKITVDTSIIRKDSVLTDRELLEMHRHPTVGFDILSKINFPWGDLSALTRHHHEKVDGKGYPDGIRGEDLLLGARIIALADAFDAMTTDRPYRKQICLRETLREIKRCVGTQFDPQVARTLFQIIEKELTGRSMKPAIIPSLRENFDSQRIRAILQEVHDDGCYPGIA
jgi:putative nucleotidyltransferase with HDIG domain